MGQLLFMKFLYFNQIIFNLFILSIYTILFSIISLGILTPTLIGCIFAEFSAIASGELNYLHRRLYLNIKKHFKGTFKATHVLFTLLVLILLSLIYFNHFSLDSFNHNLAIIIVFTQFTIAFELINIILLATILIFIFDKKSTTNIIWGAFSILNSKIHIFMMAFVSFIIIYYLLLLSHIFIFIAIPTYLFLYYMVINKVLGSSKVIKNIN